MLRVHDPSLLDAIALSASCKHRALPPQHLTNAVQGPGEMFAWHDLLMHALQGASSACVRSLRFGDMHALLWSLSRGCSWSELLGTFERWVACDPSTDVLDIGVMLAPCEAVREASLECRLWKLITSAAPLRRDMLEIVAGSTEHCFNPDAYIDRQRVATDLPGAQVARHGGHAQHKLSMLVQFVESRVTCGPRARQDVLSAIVEFSNLKANYWLKVAGDGKGMLMDCVLDQAAEARGGVRLEFGSYVGFSTIRLSGIAPAMAPRLSVQSLEVDPLHVCVSRHMLNLGERAQVAEVCTGQVKDLLPRVLEDFGSCAAGLVFMDHRGTRFHSELQLLENSMSLSPGADILCDNVLHPGAPVYLWQASQASQSWLKRQLRVWSLSEFGGETPIEDWMAHEKYQPLRKVFSTTTSWVS